MLSFGKYVKSEDLNMQQSSDFIDQNNLNPIQEQAEELMNSLFSEVEQTLSIPGTISTPTDLNSDLSSNLVRYSYDQSPSQPRDHALSSAIATINKHLPQPKYSQVGQRVSISKVNPPISISPKSDAPKTQESIGFIDSLLLGSAFTSAIFALVLTLVNLKTPAPTLPIQAQISEDPLALSAEKLRRSLVEIKPVENATLTKQNSNPASIVNAPPSKPIYIPIYQPPTPPILSPSANVVTHPPAPVAPTNSKKSLPKGSYTLIGVLDLGDRSSAMIDINGSIQSIKIGSAVGDSGWLISRIEQQAVILKRGNEDTTVSVGQKF